MLEWLAALGPFLLGVAAVLWFIFPNRDKKTPQSRDNETIREITPSVREYRVREGMLWLALFTALAIIVFLLVRDILQ